MKCRPDIEPHEIETPQVLERLVELAERRQSFVILRVLRKLRQDPDWLDREVRRIKGEKIH